jgi:16S rRNA (guanine(966)-N(2))-methyltransferase RsmD
MRVIAGRLRSRKLKSMPGLDVRPTPDRLREALFNILAPRIEGTLFVDAYAGTGSVGIEALSRGARRAVFIEHDRRALPVLRENLVSLGLDRVSEVMAGRASMLLGRYSHADIIFLDPPYPLEREYRACLDVLGEAPPVLTIVQHASRYDLPAEQGRLKRSRVVRQGDNSLSFYERNLMEV